MIENPAERVFHIDRECYLIYLGSSHTEYRPFLRIGNSPKLPEEIKKYVSTVLVTDNYTGNPFLEHENLELPLNGETRFVGDPVRIERLKQFLNEKNLPVAEYEYETIESPPQKGKSIVFFFKSGNLHVRHNGDDLFNLRQREGLDLHFVYLAERVSSYIKDNPLRYMSRVFQNPGFILLGEKLYFFHEGRLGAVHVPKDFLLTLSSAGIDPDLLQWCIEDKFEDGILQKLKRSVATKKELRLASHRIEHLRSTINLFSGMDTSLFAVEPDPSGSFHLQGFRFFGQGVSVEFPSSLGITFSLSSTHSDIKSSLLEALESKGLLSGTKIVGKVPYRFFLSPLPSPSALLLSYGISLAKNSAEVGEAEEQDWWRTVSSLLTQIQQQWNKASPRISSFESLESRFTQELPLDATRIVFPYLIWNLETLCRTIDPSATARKSVWDGFRKKAKNPGMYQLPEVREGCIPLVGDFWVLPNVVHLFYQVEGRLTPLKLVQAAKAVENIEKLRDSLGEEELFVRERVRLLRFLDQLRQVPPKRVKKAVAPQASMTQASQSESSQPSTQAPGHLETTGSSMYPPDLSTRETPLSVKPAEQEPVGSPLKNKESVSQIFSNRSWGIYVLAGLFLSGLIVALWQFDLFPHRTGSTRQSTKTPQERSIAIESASGKTEPVKSEEQNILPTSKAEEMVPKPDLLLKAGESSQGSRNPEQGRDERDALHQQRERPQKDVTGKKVIQRDTLPSTYTANIPPLGAIQITVLDVFYLVNKIADANGYRRLDSLKDLRPDPNWIYPGNRFKLPDSSIYIVKGGDTLWGITTTYIEQEVAKGIEVLKSYLGPVLESSPPKEKQSELERVIAGLQKESHCKNFVDYLEKKKKEVVYR